jgi:hypothetical protein
VRENISSNYASKLNTKTLGDNFSLKMICRGEKTMEYLENNENSEFEKNLRRIS